MMLDGNILLKHILEIINKHDVKNYVYPADSGNTVEYWESCVKFFLHLCLFQFLFYLYFLLVFEEAELFGIQNHNFIFCWKLYPRSKIERSYLLFYVSFSLNVFVSDISMQPLISLCFICLPYLGLSFYCLFCLSHYSG